MIENFALLVSVISIVLAQLIKLPIHYFIHKEWFPEIIFSTGGMPSSHSAFVSSLVVAIGFTDGVNSTTFAISVVVAGVVIHDSMGIRREAGRHATVLNQMKDKVNKIFKEVFNKTQRDIDNVDKNLKELLGHEPLEAISGTVFGVVIAFLVNTFIN